MTAGEKRVSERLEQKLDDDYLLWYDVPIGLKQRQPDFVILHPRRGLLILEVKDWKLDTIHSADRNSVTLLTSRGQVHILNPLLQARTCALEINVVLERDPALLQPESSRHGGKLVMPWGFGVVLTNITRKQFVDSQLNEVMQDQLVICKDEMKPRIDPETFQQRLWDMFLQPFPCALTLPQIDRVRWHLFPEIRISTRSDQLGLFQSEKENPVRAIEIPDLVKVLDLKQEQLARSLSEGHRVIHGVAGSGKTMLLGYRCLYLAQSLGKPILVLCYNKTLASWIRHLVAEKNLSEKVTVCNFHAWCWRMLKTYHVPFPKDRKDYDALVQAVIDGVDKKLIPRAQYGAVMVDEGHDFEPEWYKLIVRMVDPSTNSVLVLYDDAQHIYGKSSRPRFTWKSVDVEAVGHTTILKLNYRNTYEILSVASKFAHELLQEHLSDEDGVPLLTPQSAGRHGDVPSLMQARDEAGEVANIVRLVKDEQKRGTPLRDIAILYRTNAQGLRLERAFREQHMACRTIDTAIEKEQLFDGEESVKMLTMHSCKGLEYPVVIIAELGRLPLRDRDESEEARLLYVAMTRAKQRLFLTCHHTSLFTQRICEAIDSLTSDITQQATSAH